MSSMQKLLEQQKKKSQSNKAVSSKNLNKDSNKKIVNTLIDDNNDYDDDEVDVQNNQTAKDLKEFKKNNLQQKKIQQTITTEAQSKTIGWEEDEKIVVDHSINVPDVQIKEKKKEEPLATSQKALSYSEKMRLKMTNQPDTTSKNQGFEEDIEEFPEFGQEAVSKPKPKTEDKNKASADGKKKPIFTNSKMGDEKKVFKPINIINDDNVESLLENKIKFEDRKFKIEGKKDEKVAKPLELTEQQKKQMEAEKRLEEKSASEKLTVGKLQSNESAEITEGGSKPKTFINKAKKISESTEKPVVKEQSQSSEGTEVKEESKPKTFINQGKKTREQQQQQLSQQQQIEAQLQQQEQEQQDQQSEIKKPKFVNSKKKAEDIIKQNNTKLDVPMTLEEQEAQRLAEENLEIKKQKEERMQKRQFKNNNEEGGKRRSKDEGGIKRRDQQQQQDQEQNNNNEDEEEGFQVQKSHKEKKNEFQEITHKKQRKQNKEKKQKEQEKEKVVQEEQQVEQVESPKKKVVQAKAILSGWD